MKKIISFGIALLAAIFIFVSCQNYPTGSTVDVPGVSTGDVTHITRTIVQCSGEVTSSGGATVTARGLCWSKDQTPTIADEKTSNGKGVGSFTDYITDLTADTIYYVRAYAINSEGTGYGNIESFTTKKQTTYVTGKVTDIDGNTYRTVKIGNQWWMAENLKVTRYRNGDSIPNVTDPTDWAILSTGAYCDNENNVNNGSIYGHLYNWHAINDSRNMAPLGWHVPSIEEYQNLIDILGGDSVAGGKMKSIGTLYWDSPNTGATNESGFSALPAGARSCAINFRGLGNEAFFWSSTELEGNRVLYIKMVSDSTWTKRIIAMKEFGISVRCVKD